MAFIGGKHLFCDSERWQIVFELQKTYPKLLAVNYSKKKKKEGGGGAINNSQRHGRSFWCFFVLLATLKASVSTAAPWRLAAQRLRERPSTKNTNFPSSLRTTIRPPPADTKLPVIPHSVPVFQLHNGVLITESPSHMKSQTSTVTSYIYLEKWFWQTSAGPCFSSVLFLVLVL